MLLSARTPDAGFGLSFDQFVWTFGGLLWAVLALERARKFHGGAPCPQRRAPGRSPLPQHDGADTCPEDCAFFVLQTAALLCDELRRAQARGCTYAAEPVRFVRARARSRFRDAVRMVNQHEHGHLAHLPRTVLQSKWVDQALDGNAYYKRLFLDVLRHLQSDDLPEPGSDFPYGRMAADYGTDEQTIARDIETVLGLMREANPAWVDEHVDRLISQRRTRHCLPTELLDLASPADMDAREEDARDHLMAARLLDAAAHRTTSGTAPARALAGVIAERLGNRLAARAVASSDWPVLVAIIAAP